MLVYSEWRGYITLLTNSTEMGLHELATKSLLLLNIKIHHWIHNNQTRDPISRQFNTPSHLYPIYLAYISLPQASAEVKKMWIYTCTPPYAFIA
jgi:hypothetical protein